MTTAELDDLVRKYNAIQKDTPIEMRCLDCGEMGTTKAGNLSYRCYDCKVSRYTLGLSDLMKKLV